jgi:DNA-binding NtrC family response regulator
MLDSTSLIVTTDRSLVTVLRDQIRSQKVAGSRMVVCDNAVEACSLLQSVRVRLVLMHLQPEHLGYDEVDHILWVASMLRRRTHVLVVAERYVVEQATVLYRMGVTDYVSRSHHLDQLGAVVASYLPHLPAAAHGSPEEPQPARPAKAAAAGKTSAAVRARAV